MSKHNCIPAAKIHMLICLDKNALVSDFTKQEKCICKISDKMQSLSFAKWVQDDEISAV